MTRIEILATGQELIEGGVRAFEPVIEETITEARSEIQILAYMFTPQATRILDLLDDAAERGISISIIVNSLGNHEDAIKRRLKKLARFTHVRVFDFSDPERKQLHAKVMVVDRKKALVGSANFTWGGMFGNYEVGVYLEGAPAWKLANLVDNFARSVGVRQYAIS